MIILLFYRDTASGGGTTVGPTLQIDTICGNRRVANDKVTVLIGE